MNVRLLMASRGSYDGLSLKLGTSAVKHKNRSNSKIQQLTNAIEQSQEMGVGQMSTFIILIALDDLMQPNADV